MKTLDHAQIETINGAGWFKQLLHIAADIALAPYTIPTAAVISAPQIIPAILEKDPHAVAAAIPDAVHGAVEGLKDVHNAIGNLLGDH